MLSRGQEIAVDVNEVDALDVVLQPGQASLHNVLIFHSSKANRSSHRRVGLAVRYVAAHVRQTTTQRDSATLGRGTDNFGHFDLSPPPEA
jgi:ectoine hydroxylase-related dioxygenase (phytanoyl-CoA dioxygenase family)